MVACISGFSNCYNHFNCLYQKCLYDNVHIVSNFIEFENDVIKSIKGDVIHSMNKNIATVSNDVKDLFIIII